MKRKLTETLLLLFCEKNSDGTINLRLKGKDMYQRFSKRLGFDDAVFIADFLSHHLEVVKLDVCYNDIGDLGLIALVDGYLCKEENTLEHLNLMSCSITEVGMERLNAIADNLKLRVLRLNGNKLSFKGGVYASELLGKCHTLKHLDVGDTDQSVATIQYFMGVIRDDMVDCNNLTILDFSRAIPLAKTYQYDAAHIATAVCNMLRVNSSLLELHLQKNQFDGHDIEILLEGLRSNNTLLLLDLGFNRIGNHGIELLSKWLKTRPQLLGLNVAANNIGNMGARALSFGMPFSKVRLLDLTHNAIEDLGMLDILNSIKKPYMLRMFYIWGNKIKQPTFAVLQRMLLSEVLAQEQIDVKLYVVDEVLYHAYYPSNHYKHRYYCVMDHGCPIELKIKRNKIEHKYAQPRALVNFQYYDRLPLADDNLPPKLPVCESSEI